MNPSKNNRSCNSFKKINHANKELWFRTISVSNKFEERKSKTIEKYLPKLIDTPYNCLIHIIVMGIIFF